MFSLFKRKRKEYLYYVVAIYGNRTTATSVARPGPITAHADLIRIAALIHEDQGPFPNSAYQPMVLFYSLLTVRMVPA